MIMNEKIYAYLTKLRASGRINMMHSGQYLEREFGLTPREAKTAVLHWMTTFKREKTNA
jgi:hypothetical protein